MGYLGNHLATITTGIFATVLTGLWYWFNSMTPLLDFIFIMAIPITWFLTLMCWLSQKSTDYVHTGKEKKSFNNKPSLVYTSQGKAVAGKLQKAKTELTDELNTLRDTVKIKDTEIERLKQDIANLQTLVQIESLKTELANLRTLAFKK